MKVGPVSTSVVAMLATRMRHFERAVASIDDALTETERAALDVRLSVLRKLTRLVWMHAPDDPAQRN